MPRGAPLLSCVPAYWTGGRILDSFVVYLTLDLMCPSAMRFRKSESSVAQEAHGLALSMALEGAPVGDLGRFVYRLPRLCGSRRSVVRVARCVSWLHREAVLAVGSVSGRRACSVRAISTGCGRLPRLSGHGYTAGSNKSFEGTAQQLRCWVRSLRSPSPQVQR